MKQLFYIITLPVVLLLSACGPSNALIGSWEAKSAYGGSGLVEFKSSSIISTSNGVSNEIKISGYEVEKTKIGVIVEQNGQKSTVWYSIVDADTIVQDLGFMTLRYHRKK